MRILLLNWKDTDHPNAGGAEVFVHEVARRWASTGHDVTLFCARPEGLSGEDSKDGIRIIRRGNRVTVYRHARRHHRAQSDAYDLVVDVINTKPFATPRYVDGPTLAIIFQACREVWFEEFPWPVAAVGRYILEPLWLRSYRDTPSVTISDTSRRSLLEYGFRQLEIVPVGLSLPDRLPDVPRETAPTLVFVGRLAENKRPHHTIEACRILATRLPAAQLWVVGSGPMEEELRETAPSNVRFFGRVSEHMKFELLARAHALVVTSTREGWGLVVSEAAAVGTPSIGYDVDGLRDSISLSGGRLVDPSPEALADAAHHLLTVGPLVGAVVAPGGTASWDEVASRILARAPRP